MCDAQPIGHIARDRIAAYLEVRSALQRVQGQPKLDARGKRGERLRPNVGPLLDWAVYIGTLSHFSRVRTVSRQTCAAIVAAMSEKASAPIRSMR